MPCPDLALCASMAVTMAPHACANIACFLLFNSFGDLANLICFTGCTPRRLAHVIYSFQKYRLRLSRLCEGVGSPLVACSAKRETSACWELPKPSDSTLLTPAPYCLRHGLGRGSNTWNTSTMTYLGTACRQLHRLPSDPGGQLLQRERLMSLPDPERQDRFGLCHNTTCAEHAALLLEAQETLTSPACLVE